MVELKGKENKDITEELEWKLSKNKDRILTNWDNKENEEFNEENWNRTIDLIKHLITNLWTDDIDITIPDILPHPDGSFDIHWRGKNFHLTITIPSVSNMTIDIYGQKFGSLEDEIEVLIHYDLVENVVNSWLKKIL